MIKLGYPTHLQNLIYEGRYLQNDQILQEYDIHSTVTIILNPHLRGGAAGSSKSNTTCGTTGSSLPKGTEPNQEHIKGGLYKNILQGEPTTTAKTTQTLNIHNPYIVDEVNYVP